MELKLSSCVGKTIKDLLVFLCQVIELLHNTLWWYLLCPLLCNTMVVAEFMINVVDTLFWE